MDVASPALPVHICCMYTNRCRHELDGYYPVYHITAMLIAKKYRVNHEMQFKRGHGSHLDSEHCHEILPSLDVLHGVLLLW